MSKQWQDGAPIKSLESEKIHSDRVNHPNYYQLPNGIECLDVVRYFDFDIGNVIKYCWRCGRKTEQGLTNIEKEIEDLEKASVYLKDKIQMLKNETINS